MRKVDWILIVLILIGYVFGNLIGSLFPDTFLNYGGTFGLTTPVELNLGLIQLTFGLVFNVLLSKRSLPRRRERRPIESGIIWKCSCRSGKAL